MIITKLYLLFYGKYPCTLHELFSDFRCSVTYFQTLSRLSDINQFLIGWKHKHTELLDRVCKSISYWT